VDIESLEVFLTIARFGSINKAANALFLAQSTVTHRLKRLEKYAGAPLFIRTATGVSLTAEGRQLLPVATAVVEQMRAFTRRNERRQALTIVAGKAFASYELPRLLGKYRRAHPHFTCYVRSTLYDESITSLLTGTADIAFLGSEVYHPQLHQVFLPSDRILLVVSPEHRWAQQYEGFHDWGLQEVIAFGSSTAPFRQRVDRYLAENGVFPNVIMELDSFIAVKQMVMQNLGVAMLPERTIGEELRTGKLVALDIADGKLTRPTLIAFSHHKKEDPQFMQIVDWIVKEY
jgi:DNA-binding transcriptional LysR family regulator